MIKKHVTKARLKLLDAQKACPLPPKSFGYAVREERVKARLTQLELAKMAGTNIPMIWCIENYGRIPKRKLIFDLCTALGVGPWSMFKKARKQKMRETLKRDKLYIEKRSGIADRVPYYKEYDVQKYMEGNGEGGSSTVQDSKGSSERVE